MELIHDNIKIREAVTHEETAFFWEQLHTYHKRDIFPDPNDCDREYFLDDTQYRACIEQLHSREHDTCRYILMSRGNEDIGFALTVIYDSEDGKCFLMEFCVLPEFRGFGTGTACAEAFLTWAKAHGATYTELNCSTAQRQRLWKRLGFIMNGVDEWGVPLMLLPPKEPGKITIELLSGVHDAQLLRLENSYLSEIGEDALTEEKAERLSLAIAEGNISFLVAKRSTRIVGMCSITVYFSTFNCSCVGIFEDFYIEPAFRKIGIARMLAEASQRLCREKGFASLSVTCAPCDESMYKALGFNISLGSTYAHIE